MAKTRQWFPLVRGLQYSKDTVSDVWSSNTVWSFRVDLRTLEPRILLAKDLGTRAAHVSALAAQRRAVLAINGGFFTPTFQSLGLLVDRRRVLNPLRRADWGVLYVKSGSAALVHTKQFRKTMAVDFAIQAGPRLVVNGAPLKLKEQWAHRTAIGIADPHHLVVVATRAAILTRTLAETFAKSEADGGFGCRFALNLDGGSSTQLYLNTAKLRLNLRGLARVANAVAFIPR